MAGQTTGPITAAVKKLDIEALPDDEVTTEPCAGVRVGRVLDLRVNTTVIVGGDGSGPVRQLNANVPAVHGKDGWTVVIDDIRNAVWVGYDNGKRRSWSLVPMSNVTQVRFTSVPL